MSIWDFLQTEYKDDALFSFECMSFNLLLRKFLPINWKCFSNIFTLVTVKQKHSQTSSLDRVTDKTEFFTDERKENTDFNLHTLLRVLESGPEIFFFFSLSPMCLAPLRRTHWLTDWAAVLLLLRRLLLQVLLNRRPGQAKTACRCLGCTNVSRPNGFLAWTGSQPWAISKIRVVKYLTLLNVYFIHYV